MRSIVVSFTLGSTLLACGGAAATGPAPGNTSDTLATPGSLYEPLFVGGNHWTFAVTHKVTPAMDLEEAPSETTEPDITCKVEMVNTEIAVDVRWSKIVCVDVAGQVYAEAPAGVMVANAQGLSWFTALTPEIEAAAKAGTIDKMDVLLTPMPAAREEQQSMGGEDGPAEDRMTFAREKDGAWCVGSGFAAGDEAGYEFCLRDGKGLVSASSYQAGATTYETFLVVK